MTEFRVIRARYRDGNYKTRLIDAQVLDSEDDGKGLAQLHSTAKTR